MNKETTYNGNSVEDDDQITDDEQSDIVRQWESLTLTHDVLFKQLARANVKLSKQNNRLKSELSVYRAGWLTLERENEEHLAQATQYEKALHKYENDRSLVTCLIDGNSAIFNEDHVAKGNAGGREAASQLSQGIAQYLDGQLLDGNSDKQDLPQHHQITASIFLDVSALADKLSLNGICSTRDFEQFVLGFNQASPLLTMVDVGPDKEAADAKMKGTLFYYSRLNQTRHVIFCGSQEAGGLPNLKDLQSEGLLDKLTILKGSGSLSPRAETLCKKNNVKIIEFLGLFMQRELTSDSYEGMPPPPPPFVEPEPEPEPTYTLPWTVHPDSLPPSKSAPDRPISAAGSRTHARAPTSIAPSSVADGSTGRQTPENGRPPRRQRGRNKADKGGSSGIPEQAKSERRDRQRKDPQKNERQQQDPASTSNKDDDECKIDLKQGLLAQTPPLCYLHHLSTCPKGPKCPRSHKYILNEGQMKSLRNQVKHLPCIAQNNTQYGRRPCPDSAEACVMNHYCPRGPSCSRNTEGTCIFKGKGMHDPQPGPQTGKAR